MLRTHILDNSSTNQLNWNLMMNIRAPSRHKIAKWVDRKSKMAATAAILKINFQHLFPNFGSLWEETCTGATWSKRAKFWWSEFQDGRNCSTPLNEMATRATKRKTSKDISSLTNGPISKYLHRRVLPITSTKIAKMVPLGWTKWQSELKIEKPLKRHLLYGQWPNFRVISQKCFSYGPLPKLLRWYHSAEQNCHQS